ncbi:hypothetical protein RvY_14771 [Ramazzottius varieornatus]|uniref:Reverse transcriptase domain-containing protein n=1 Tax=Ramazzottius varieornatus TaxID=947166 RepID=A0A1D1VSF7_RAMVA|nr:hypothetical protein RvY_14771 [Ramazzottius varieornatus]
MAERFVAKEVRLEHSAGPFNDPPFPNFVCFSLGLRPKKNGGGRLIMDLSRPFDYSVNDFINKDFYTLRYCTVDDAIALITKAGRSCLLSKTDLVGAFCLIPVHPSDWHYLCFFLNGKYYFGQFLPLGVRSSPALFNQLSLILIWVIKKAGYTSALHYMDDFLFVGAPETSQCNDILTFMKAVCADLGVPLAPEKTVSPTTTLDFLGITLDTVNFTLSIPDGKIQELTECLSTFKDRHKATKREILSLAGKLSWCTTCISAGRIFLRRILDLAMKARRLGHQLKLSPGFFDDLQWWTDFLPLWNGKASFLQPYWTEPHSLDLYTDAAGSVGRCGFLAGKWFQILWPPWVIALNPPIA